MNGGGKGCGEAEKPPAVDSFRLITITLLSLLLPLSFLLLSRVSSASFFLSLLSSPSSSLHQPQTASSFFLYANPAFVCAFISLTSLYTLVHALATKITAGDGNRWIAFSPHISVSWLILSLVQISIGLGLALERTVSEEANRIIITSERSFLTRLMFFFGLHEVMLLWYRVIVRPVVDSTLLGEGFRHVRGETVAEKVALAVSCWTLWWWKLRDEVEALVGVAEAKRALLLLLPIDGDVNFGLDVGTVDFVNWWLYYMVVAIGMVRIVKGSLWFGMILLLEQGRKRNPCEISTISADSTIHYEGDNKSVGDNKV